MMLMAESPFSPTPAHAVYGQVGVTWSGNLPSDEDGTWPYSVNNAIGDRRLPQPVRDEQKSPVQPTEGDLSSIFSTLASSTACDDLQAVAKRNLPFQAPTCADNVPTTSLMICNIPCRIMQNQLVEVVDQHGFYGKYDLIYLPRGGRAGGAPSNLGYGFINFMAAADATEFAKVFDRYQFGGTGSTKTCAVRPAHIQGFAANIQNFTRSSARSRMRTPAKAGKVPPVEAQPYVPEYVTDYHTAQGTSPPQPQQLPPPASLFAVQPPHLSSPLRGDIDIMAARDPVPAIDEIFEEETAICDNSEIYTSLMICNIPCRITQRQLAEAVNQMGFGGKYDLIYLPICGRSGNGMSNLGYGFINFMDPDDARLFSNTFSGYRFRGTGSTKECVTRPAHIQGFSANMQNIGRVMAKHQKSDGTTPFDLGSTPDFYDKMGLELAQWMERERELMRIEAMELTDNNGPTWELELKKGDGQEGCDAEDLFCNNRGDRLSGTTASFVTSCSLLSF